MSDQAAALRRIVRSMRETRGTCETASIQPAGARVVTVTSGKGGVGKTNFSVNLALGLAQKGKKVLIIDADFGFANVDLLLGATPEHDLSQLISGERRVEEIMCSGPMGVKFVSGGSGVLDLQGIEERRLSCVVEALLELERFADIIIFDTGAGISGNILRMVEASAEVVIVTTPEPTAIMDAYSLLKTVVLKDNTDTEMSLVINKAESRGEAERTMDRFSGIVRHYLGKNIRPIGYILNDEAVIKAVKRQAPFILSFPKCEASDCMRNIVSEFLREERMEKKPGLRSFFKNLLGSAAMGVQ